MRRRVTYVLLRNRSLPVSSTSNGTAFSTTSTSTSTTANMTAAMPPSPSPSFHDAFNNEPLDVDVASPVASLRSVFEATPITKSKLMSMAPKSPIEKTPFFAGQDVTAQHNVLPEFAAEYASASSLPAESKVRQEAMELCREQMAEHLEQSLYGHIKRFYKRLSKERRFRKQRNGAGPRIAPWRKRIADSVPYEIETDNAQLCSFARFYGSRFPKEVLPHAVLLFAQSISDTPAPRDELKDLLDPSRQMHVCDRAAEFLLRSTLFRDKKIGVPADTMFVFNNCRRRGAKFEANVVMQFLKAAIISHDLTVLSALITYVGESEWIPIETLSPKFVAQALPLVSNGQYARWTVPFLMKALWASTEQVDWSMVLYGRALRALKYAKDVDGIMAIFERFRRETSRKELSTSADPFVMCEVREKFRRTFAALHVLVPLRNCIEEMDWKVPRKTQMTMLLLEAHAGSWQSFQNAYERIIKDDVSVLERHPKDISKNFLTRIGPIAAQRLFALARHNQSLDTEEAQHLLLHCEYAAPLMLSHTALAMHALHMVGNTERALALAEHCDHRTVQTESMFLRATLGQHEEVVSLLNQIVHNVEQCSAASMKMQLMRPQMFAASMAALLNSPSLSIAEKSEKMGAIFAKILEMGLLPSTSCSRLYMAAVGLGGDVTKFGNLRQDLDEKVKNLSPFQKHHPEVVYTRVDLIDGRVFDDSR